MSISWQRLGEAVFLIERGGGLPLIYAPLQGLIMEVNHSYGERFRDALDGEPDAAEAIGVDRATIERLAAIPPKAESRLNPGWPDTFEPTSVSLFLTHKCTLRCSYCYCDGGDGRDIEWPVLAAAVDFALENAFRKGEYLSVSFHGGDVGACWTLFERAVEHIREEAASTGVSTALNIGTNGFYSEDQAAYLARHVQSATVSVDGLADVHDRYRVTAGGAPTLETVLRSTRIFDENGLKYSIRMTVHTGSLASLSESVEFLCENTTAEVIRAEPLYSRGRARAVGLQAPAPEPFVRAFRKASEVAKRHGRSLTYSGARPAGAAPSFCSYPGPTFGVTPEANLTCCYEVLQPDDALAEEFFFGHVEVDGSAIHADPVRIEAIRAEAAKRREACEECFCVFACAGDCAAKSMDSGVAPGGSSSRCEITRALTLDMIEAALDGTAAAPHEKSACHGTCA